tara:strand:+ start:382 stop:534 length:153 start_codon:yes stop_codon:yes gene_type:complete
MASKGNPITFRPSAEVKRMLDKLGPKIVRSKFINKAVEQALIDAGYGKGK